MKYRHVGRTGLVVSRVCLGAMTFDQRDWGCDEATARAIVHAFVGAGGNFIDTADGYSGGRSEEVLGRVLKDFDRDDIVLATKAYFRTGPTANARGLSRKHLMEACEASLRRLQTDYIDLYQIHGPDPRTPIEETLRTLDDLVHQGKVRYLGCSNHFAWQLVKANGLAALHGWEPLACGQYLYNLIARDVEREILPACAEQGLGFICWSPLASGMLTGKYREAPEPEAGTRFHHRRAYDVPRYWHERGFRVTAELVAVAGELSVPPSHAALAWLLHDPRVTAVIVGARRIDQIQENLAVGDWSLPQEAWDRLDQAAAIDLGYPQQWIDFAHQVVFDEEQLG